MISSDTGYCDFVLMADKRLPPGYRFRPTDEELVMFYLKRKVNGKSVPPETISELNVYKFAPWDLPNFTCLRSKDLIWYFFCPSERKYASGNRANRATELGYWKATGNDKCVSHKQRTVGKRKTLVFHIGKSPKGDRTDWVMHEYRLSDKNLAENVVSWDAYTLCKVFEKSGSGPKNGEEYGAPFIEEEWDDADANNELSSVQMVGGVAVSGGGVPTTSEVFSANPQFAAAVAPPPPAPPLSSSTFEVVSEAVTSMGEVNNPIIDDDNDELLEQLLSMFDDEGVNLEALPQAEQQNGGSDIFDGLEDFLELRDLED
ncbi:hypothetical protein Nepgr_009538 [Nepenthes gracilis]|uniref:NAC domain-containing protein n=1 Tax=Nepenthes gracilis TaxID=150966 RepID=A0AAD3SAQ6_NEPGR|nr:hypothetical protein Nepgr_009538 [Nepenthes gracilis]